MSNLTQDPFEKIIKSLKHTRRVLLGICVFGFLLLGSGLSTCITNHKPGGVVLFTVLLIILVIETFRLYRTKAQ